MKTILTIAALTLVSATAMANGQHGIPVDYSVGTFTGSLAGTGAGVAGGTNTHGSSISMSSAWNKNSAEAQVNAPRYGAEISSSSEAKSISGAKGFNKSTGTGFGGYGALSGGFAGAAGSAGTLTAE
jgi:hypothetical protein